MVGARQLVYLGMKGVAGRTGLGPAWARAAVWYVWDRASIDPGAGKQLFQIVGVPRSGTTLLANLVSAHPDAYCMVEPYRGYYVRGYSSDRGEVADCHPNAFVSRVMRNRPERQVGVKETFLSSSYPRHRNEPFFDRLAALGVTTIAILRDPRDAYASFIDAESELGADVSLFASNWQEFARWSDEHADLAVTYESLVLEPEETMSEVLKVLGLEVGSYQPIPQPVTYSAEELGDPVGLVSRSIDRSRIGSYATVLPPAVVAEIERQCGREMAALNYL